MIINKIQLQNFKNYEQKVFDFSSKINCFVGENGIGKTNILEAIHYLAFSKGFAHSLDKHNIQFEKDFFIIEAMLSDNQDQHQLSCIVQKGKKKRFKKNESEYKKIADYIGFLSLVMISPYDRDLIVEGAESRRRLTDSIISQVDKVYLEDLMTYNRTVQQRNALLKYFAKNACFDATQLEVYDRQLDALGSSIHQKRKAFVELLRPLIQAHYSKISKQKEEVDIHYQSQLSDHSFFELLNQNQAKDRLIQHTSVGIHRDDIQFLIEGNSIKRFGSQGQQKSML
ncbi:MAG: DNA replication/repair protein RecF, partial [Flavobacteriales bacterium]